MIFDNLSIVSLLFSRKSQIQDILDWLHGVALRSAANRNKKNREASVIGGFMTSAPAAPDAVDSDEASSSEDGQDAAGDGGPEAPAEIRVVLTRRCLGAVITARETAERRQRRCLQHNYNNNQLHLQQQRIRLA